MAYVAPSTRTTGTLITASIWNQDVVANPIAIYAGGMSIASQATRDFIYAASATQLARLAQGTALQFPRINAAGTAWEFAAGNPELLIAASGTTTSTSAENVSTVALTNLTAKDTIIAFVDSDCVTQGINGDVWIRNVTDGVNIMDVGTPTAGTGRMAFTRIRQAQHSNVVVNASVFARTWTGTDGSGAKSTTVTTAWTGSWTMSLYHAGVVSGGTWRWSWAAFVLRGQ